MKFQEVKRKSSSEITGDQEKALDGTDGDTDLPAID